jgi:hypothetical protein
VNYLVLYRTMCPCAARERLAGLRLPPFTDGVRFLFEMMGSFSASRYGLLSSAVPNSRSKSSRDLLFQWRL